MTTTSERSAKATDLIDHLAGIAPGSRLAQLRAARPEIARLMQTSAAVLLDPAEPGGVSLAERDAITLRVATLTGQPALAARHRMRLHERGMGAAEIGAIAHHPTGRGLSPRLAAILDHTEKLTSEPSAATPADIETLKAAGLAPADIVTVAQLIAFLSFQVRVLAALRPFSEEAEA